MTDRPASCSAVVDARDRFAARAYVAKHYGPQLILPPTATSTGACYDVTVELELPGRPRVRMVVRTPVEYIERLRRLISLRGPTCFDVATAAPGVILSSDIRN